MRSDYFFYFPRSTVSDEWQKKKKKKVKIAHKSVMDSRIINLTLSFIYFIDSPLIHLFTHSDIILLLTVAPQI